LEHVAQLLTFIPLAVTGLVQRYAGAAISKGIIGFFGGIERVRIIHRFFAVGLMIAVVYHLGAIGYRRFVLGRPRSMGLGRTDVRAAAQTLAYNLGRRDTRPRQGRFTFEEKLEYWSLVWGTVLMVVTGFLLWNPIASVKILPGSFIPAAKAAHGAEAVLAVLAVIVWHMYHVHVRHFNKSIFTGYLSIEAMERDHPLELAIESVATPTLEELRRRRQRFVPLYSLGSLVLLGGIWMFVTFEDTAITTVAPIENPDVFAPVTTRFVPPTTPTSPTPATTTTSTATTTTGGAGKARWDDFAPSFQATCTGCHGQSSQFGGLDLTTYASAFAGGTSGPAIVPGDPSASLIVTIQEAGGHPGQLDAASIAELRAWIDSGAPEG
jgi:cytochrome b subunit of formate dehydrogenase